jgi:hypothetical protein
MIKALSDPGKKKHAQALAKAAFTDLEFGECRNCLDKLGQIKALSHLSRGRLSLACSVGTSPLAVQKSSGLPGWRFDINRAARRLNIVPVPLLSMREGAGYHATHDMGDFVPFGVAAQRTTGRTSRHTPVASIEGGSRSSVSDFAILQGISGKALRFAVFSDMHAEFPPQ